METGLEGIAAKARRETKLKFTSLCHHVTRELIWGSLNNIPKQSAPGADGIIVEEAKKTLDEWIDGMLASIHRKAYHAPPVRRVWIPKPGKATKRPIGVPCMADRALQRSVSIVLSSIYEQDFLPCSFGGRPGLGAHHALSTLNEVIVGKKVSWVFEADLKNFFGSLDHEWLLRFVEHRVGDLRITSLIKRWLKAGVLEEGELKPVEMGTPQGGSISVLLSNIYLHYVLDLWFEKVIKPKLKGDAYLVRYVDDFVVCFQYRSDATLFQEMLVERLGKFSLELEPEKTHLVEFGRYALREAKEKGKRLETIYFLGFTHYCTRNRKGKFMLGCKTEKSRFRRSVQKMQTLMQEIMHHSLKDQIKKINQVLRGHYAYYGVGGNFKSLCKIYRIAEKYWRKMLSSRSQKSCITWERFNYLKQVFPLQQPKLSVPFGRMKALAVL
jgi:group II intron reverse transcriptase/maturase